MKTVLPIVIAGLMASNCANNDLNKKFDCSTSDLDILLADKTNATGCKSIDGKFTVAGMNGKPPYDYSVNGGNSQTNPEFTNLGSGNYSVTVKDANGCTKELDVIIDAANSTLNATLVVVKNSQCLSPNGSIVINGTGGTPPYTYQFGIDGFSSSNSAVGLKEGTYRASVKDANDCLKAFGIVVGRENTGIRYSTDIKPILDKSCNLSSCHGAGNGARDWTNFNNLVNNSENIKLRTRDKSMPAVGNGVDALTQSQIDLISCWVDDGTPNN